MVSLGALAQLDMSTLEDIDDASIFAQRLSGLARQQGWEISVAECEEVIQATHGVGKPMPMSDEELELVASGCTCAFCTCSYQVPFV
jgi:hypothetical protein